MLLDYFGYIILAIIAFSLASVFTIIGLVLGPKADNPAKQAPFETGLAFVPSPKNVQVKFYLVAMIFLLFDVEVAFLYPYALLVKELGTPGLVLILIFSLLLFLGIIYEYKRKLLKWS